MLVNDSGMFWRGHGVEALQRTRGCVGGAAGETKLVGSGETNMIGWRWTISNEVGISAWRGHNKRESTQSKEQILKM